MNSYELSRAWFDFCFENPEKINPSHTAFYFFCIEHCNRLGWKDKFGLPTEMVKDALGIRNYKTYSKVLNDVIDFGFIKLIEKSKNQYSANIIALVKNTKALNKANTKALDKAMIKHGTKQVQSIVSIDKQYNKEQINQLTKNHIEVKAFLQTLSPTSKKTISDRKEKFKILMSEKIKGTDFEKNKDELNKFYSYWTEHGDEDKKMRFEKEKSFSIKRRLTTWFNNNYSSSNKNQSVKTSNYYKPIGS